MFSPLKNVVTHSLSNGMQVLFKEDHAWPLVSLHAWVHVGSIDEHAAQAGIAHVLEHMVFKGTHSFRAEEIARSMEMLGGAMNAETSKEYTHYYIDIPSAGAQKAVGLLGELLHRAVFDVREWERERPVILEEIKRRNDDPDALLWDLLNEAVFPPGDLSRPVIGSTETVSALKPADLQTFYQEFYRTHGSIFIVAGDFKPKPMLAWLEKAFDRMPRGRGRPRTTPKHVSGYVPRDCTLQRPVKQDYVALAFPTPSSSHPDHEGLDVLAAVLGEGRSSRLVHILREKKKIVWSVSSANYGHEGPGVFSVFAECSASRRKQLRREVEQIFDALRKRPLPNKELARAKNIIQNGWLQSFETYHQQASILGLYALDNQLSRLDSYLPRIAALQGADLQKIAARYLLGDSLSSAVITA